MTGEHEVFPVRAEYVCAACGDTYDGSMGVPVDGVCLMCRMERQPFEVWARQGWTVEGRAACIAAMREAGRRWTDRNPTHAEMADLMAEFNLQPGVPR